VAGVGDFLAVRTGDRTIAALATAAVLVSLARLANVLLYRRGVAGGPLDAASARIWERWYGAGSVCFATLLGALCAVIFSLADPVAQMLVTGLLCGYCSGVLVRVSVRPVICSASLIVAVIPAVFVLATHQDLAYLSHGVLLLLLLIGGLEGARHIFRTNVQQITARQQLASLARNDPLTGLANRILLREQFDHDVASLSGSGAFMAVHCLDLDHFKPINDEFGHPVGDAVLKLASERLLGLLREGDTAARIGGDEFVLLQSGIRSSDEAELLARRAIRTLSAPFSVEGRVLSIGASIGIAFAPRDGVTLEALTAAADTALYQSKR
jgi:diguanylate cyclase (GGDEF)-like protein